MQTTKEHAKLPSKKKLKCILCTVWSPKNSTNISMKAPNLEFTINPTAIGRIQGWKNPFIKFGLILYVPVNSFSVMSGQVFLGLTSTKQRINPSIPAL